MTIYIASKTLKAIDDMLEADQGNSWRGWMKKVIPFLDDAYRSDEDGHRSHLGASLLGDDCARKLWYGFRWAKKPVFRGQILRLFNRGHLEEGRVIALLLAAGIRVYQTDENGKQFRISHYGGHVGGSGDGRTDNCPDVPEGHWCCLEFKTHNEKSFTGVAGPKGKWSSTTGHPRDEPVGVKAGKPEHFIQMILYMEKMGIHFTLYIAVNKDTDELYGEIVPANPELAQQYLERGENIVKADKPPQRIANSAGDYRCTFCDFKKICHVKAPAEVNCRTCVYSSPMPDGMWICRKFDGALLSKEFQHIGCNHHTPINMSC